MSKNNTGKEIESSNYFMKIVDWLALVHRCIYCVYLHNIKFCHDQKIQMKNDYFIFDLSIAIDNTYICINA